MSFDIETNKNAIIDYDDNAEKFKKIRVANGFGRIELAELLGLSDPTVISHIEHNVYGLDSRVYTLFCLLMDCHPTHTLKRKLTNLGSILIEPPAGEEIRKIRNGLGITQPKMAKLLGLTGKTHISKYENDAKKPSIHTWTMWLLIINQHPYFSMRKKANKSDEV